MLIPKYVHLKPSTSPNNVEVNAPFAAVVIIDAVVLFDWRRMVSEWLVKTGCKYMMTSGNDCSLWDDSVDTANLEAFNWGNIPDDKFVTTTWHEDESIEEVFYFAINSALPFSPLIEGIIILDITDNSREHDILARYTSAQDGNCKDNDAVSPKVDES